MPRRLAAFVEPAPGEAFHSWIIRLAAYLQIPVGYVPELLGLEYSRWEQARPYFYGIVLTTSSRANIAAATGLPATVFDRMHLAAFHGNVLDLRDLDSAIDQPQFAAQITSRACPACLTESGGVWQLWWRLGFASVCPTHRLLLHDECPRCRRRFGPGGIGHPFEWRELGSRLRRGRTIDPMQCGAVGNTGRGCDCPMEDLPRIRVPDFLVEVQARYLAGLTGAQMTIGANQLPAFLWYRIVHRIAAVYNRLAPYLHVPRLRELPEAARSDYHSAVREKLSMFDWSPFEFAPRSLYDPSSGLPRWLEGDRLRLGPPLTAGVAAVHLSLLHPLLTATDIRSYQKALRRLHTDGQVLNRAHSPPRDLPEFFRQKWATIAASKGRRTPLWLLSEPIEHPGPLPEVTRYP